MGEKFHHLWRLCFLRCSHHLISFSETPWLLKKNHVCNGFSLLSPYSAPTYIYKPFFSLLFPVFQMNGGNPTIQKELLNYRIPLIERWKTVQPLNFSIFLLHNKKLKNIVHIIRTLWKCEFAVRINKNYMILSCP